MKKTEKKALPKFKALTLGAEELGKTTGGLLQAEYADCTCGTVSICHIDGTTDSD